MHITIARAALLGTVAAAALAATPALAQESADTSTASAANQQTQATPAEASDETAREVDQFDTASSAARRQVTSLRDFDEHMLSDIGLTRRDVHEALQLPFGSDPARELQARASRNRRRGWNE